jgi:uncharacterized cupin superfamily protein
MPLDRVIRFGPDGPSAECSRPSAPISGEPVQAVRNFYSDPSGSFFAGIWESTPGKWRVNYTEEEFCHLLSGTVVLEDDQGNVETFAAGDAFVIRAGFTGTWETVGVVRKLYAIFERPKSAAD